MIKKTKDFLIILLLTLIPTLLIWLPFFLRLKTFWTIPLPQQGMATIVSNFDGPLYIVVAKSLFNLEIIKSFPLDLPTKYYAAHFPLFPLLIRGFSYLLGYPYSMLLVTLISSMSSLYFFYKLAQKYTNRESALWLTFFFSILPARWLVVRSVGSAEPLFITAILASIYFFKKQKYWLAGIWGALAQLTKSPGILLFVAYFANILMPNYKEITTTKYIEWSKHVKPKKLLPLLLIPASLILVFTLYAFTYKDFFAYFNSGDNIHLFFPPFTIFNYSAPWVGTFWLEEIVFIYMFGALAFTKLLKNKRDILTWFFGIFFFSTLFVSHRDILRYSLPIIPLVFIAFRKTLLNKNFRYILAFITIPVFLFSLAYISQNVMPIGNWAPFL